MLLKLDQGPVGKRTFQKKRNLIWFWIFFCQSRHFFLWTIGCWCHAGLKICVYLGKSYENSFQFEMSVLSVKSAKSFKIGSTSSSGSFFIFFSFHFSKTFWWGLSNFIGPQSFTSLKVDLWQNRDFACIKWNISLKEVLF